jgi:hypothetical protein
MRVVVSFVVENHYELISLDLDTMHGKANPQKITERFNPPSYFVVCETCRDSQPVTIEFVEPTTGAGT